VTQEALFVQPRPIEVIMGKGVFTNKRNNHPGNIWYRQLLMEHFPIYEQADLFIKPRVTDLVLEKNTTAGGRGLFV
jgi:hypothetical protein